MRYAGSLKKIAPLGYLFSSDAEPCPYGGHDQGLYGAICVELPNETMSAWGPGFSPKKRMIF
jgi:hypothetical protein